MKAEKCVGKKLGNWRWIGGGRFILKYLQRNATFIIFESKPLSMFDFLQFMLYDFDHNPPHFHAIYAEYKILVSIITLEALKGEMPKPQLKRILKWATLNQSALLEEFEYLNPQLRR